MATLHLIRSEHSKSNKTECNPAEWLPFSMLALNSALAVRIYFSIPLRYLL